jgi:hypothetical protein
MNVHPYYVYVHDLVKGVEDLRTTVQTALELEKRVRGTTAGFNTPTFVVRRARRRRQARVHSYEYYDRDSGISVYTPSTSSRPTQARSVSTEMDRPPHLTPMNRTTLAFALYFDDDTGAPDLTPEPDSDR